MGRSPVLDDAQTPGRDLLPDAMVQQDDAVGDELLNAVPGQLVRLVPLGSNNRGQSSLFEPIEEAADFGAEDRWVGQIAEERLNGVQDNSPRPNPLDGIGNSYEEALEVILAGFA